MSEIQRLPVTLTAPGERALRSGHPWLFDGAIRSVKGDGKVGDLAIIFSFKKNKCIGLGLFDPDSPIRIRVLSVGPAKIDAAFFQEKFAAARALREGLLKTETNGYRLIHGENDGLPGMVVDVYAGVCVLKIYSPAWLPWLPTLQPIILEAAGSETLVLRLARVTEGAAAGAELRDGQLLAGELPNDEVVFQEHGIDFYANVVKGHKTGFFLDHRANRKRIGELASGKDVLDVFSYAGGFSVHALAGGARRVTSLDISEPALAQASRNVRLNFGGDAAATTERHETLAADAFEGLAALARDGEAFDIIIVDPPSFAKSDKEIAGALAAYRKINRLAIPLVVPGGILVAASCSARVPAEDFFRVIAVALQASGRKHKLLEQSFHDVDHPIGFPEGAYLKTVYYRVW